VPVLGNHSRCLVSSDPVYQGLPVTAYNVPIIELRMATANLVRDLDLKFAPGYKETWESDWEDYFVIKRGKLPIIATPRA